MFTTLVALGTIALQVGSLVLFIGMLAKAKFVSAVATRANLLLRVLFLAAIVSSLIYQYGFGYEPCLLCWYQRIAIFAIGIIAWTADVRKSALLRTQTLILGVAGFAVALFHNHIDIFPTGLDVCGATGPSCLARYVYEFGYITIPMMSATILLAGILLVLAARCYPQAPLVTERR
jgi:disulfide bond formation protein DsbB